MYTSLSPAALIVSMKIRWPVTESRRRRTALGGHFKHSLVQKLLTSALIPQGASEFAGRSSLSFWANGFE